MAKKGSSIFTRILQLVLDKTSIEKTRRDTQKGLKEATDPKAAEQNIGRVAAGFNKARLAAVAFVAAGLALVATALRKVTQESIASQKAMAQQEAVLKSTGMAAGRTAEQLNEQAEALARVTTFEDDAITGAQNLLLTFRQIRGEEFDDAVEASLDLATALGVDASQAALQLGKALQDPITGLTALRRSGISFSETQRDVIKQLVETGRVAEAQRLILRELEVQFGGSAVAARDTLGGALEGLRNAWSDLFEVSRESSAGMIAAINGIAESLPHVRDFFDRIFRSIAVGGANAAVALAQLQLVAAQILRFTPLGTVMDMFVRGNETKRQVDEARKNLEAMRAAAAEVIAEMDGTGASGKGGVPAVVRDIAEAGKGAEEALEKAHKALMQAQEERLGFLKQAHELGIQTNAEFTQLLAIHQSFTAELGRGNVELERRLFLNKQIKEIEAAMGLGGVTARQAPRPDIPDLTAGRRDAEGNLRIAAGALGLRPDQIPDDDPVVQAYRDQWLEAHAGIQASAQSAAFGVMGAWQDAIEAIAVEGEGLSGFMEALFKGVAGAALGGLAQLASAKVAENIARAFEEAALATGRAAVLDFAGAAAHAASAKTHGLAAAKWALVGGTAAAAQSAIAGGGRGGQSGGLPTGARDPAGRLADRVENQRTITIYQTIDGIDPKNGRHQRLVGDTVVNQIQRVGSKITDGSAGIAGARR